MSAPDTIDMAGLVDLFELSRRTLVSRLPRWQAEGFPAPLPWRGAKLRWRREAVMRWKAAQELRAGCNGRDAA